MSVSLHRHCTALLACMLLASAAHAQSDVAHPAYVAVGAAVDGDDSSALDIEAGLPLGRHAWLYAGGGQEAAEDGSEELDATVWRAGIGVGGEHVEFTTTYVRRKDGAFEQDDWAFALDWRGARGGIGADYFARSSQAETVASIQRRRLTPLAVRVVESLDGEGYGAHGDFDVTEQFNVFASFMNYDYVDVGSNHPFLSRLLFLGGSGVTRESAFLEQTFGVGVTYRFVSTSLTLQYLRDEALETRDVTDTGELALVVLVGTHWSITPSIGYSDSETDGGLVYGGLSAGYNW